MSRRASRQKSSFFILFTFFTDIRGAAPFVASASIVHAASMALRDARSQPCPLLPNTPDADMTPHP
jgi:hypothetical protein